MDLPEIREILHPLAGQPLLALAIVAILLVVAGGMIRRALPRIGGFVRGLGNLGLTAAL
jgi:aspartyl protease family protein